MDKLPQDWDAFYFHRSGIIVWFIAISDSCFLNPLCMCIAPLPLGDLSESRDRQQSSG
jgi:hypothetical protein